jgi:hypothetical protein
LFICSYEKKQKLYLSQCSTIIIAETPIIIRDVRYRTYCEILICFLFPLICCVIFFRKKNVFMCVCFVYYTRFHTNSVFVFFAFLFSIFSFVCDYVKCKLCTLSWENNSFILKRVSQSERMSLGRDQEIAKKKTLILMKVRELRRMFNVLFCFYVI